MKLVIIFLSVIAIILLAFAGVVLLQNKKSMPLPNTAGAPVLTTIPKLEFNTPITIEGTKLFVAVANTDESRQQGLSGQPQLADDQGMLFDFKNAERNKPGFWMKEMLFSLDMIWIRDNTVIDITKNVPLPVPNAALSSLPLYFPSQPIDTVVEVSAGWCERHGVSMGAKLK